MKKNLVIFFVLISIMCTSCGQITATQSEDETLQETTTTTTLETSSQEVATIGDSETIEETSIVEVNTPKLYPEQMFNQMLENLEGMTIDLDNMETSTHKMDIQSSDIEKVSSYFEGCTFEEYTLDDFSYSGLHMLINFFIRDNDGNICDSYAINFFDVSNRDDVSGNCLITIKSSNDETSQNYITKVEDIQAMFED